MLFDRALYEIRCNKMFWLFVTFASITNSVRNEVSRLIIQKQLESDLHTSMGHIPLTNKHPLIDSLESFN